MKIFFTVFFAILAAATVILAGLWGKSRVDAWEWAWRSYEAQMSAIVSSHSALTSASEYTSSFGSSSVEASMARVREAEMNLKRIEADQARIADLERQTIAILEQKPFGLPLTASESKELAMLKEDVQKHPKK
jgi:hypothetical protein